MNPDMTQRDQRLLSLAAQYGTPLYVSDAGVIAEQVRAFRQAFARLPVRIFYAAKALTSLSVLKLMRALGTGLDTVSPAEVQMGLMAGFAPDEMVFTPNMVSFDEIREAVERGLHINIENLSNLERLGRAYGAEVGCFVRLSPDFIGEQESPDRREWQKRTKFGIALSQWDRLEAIVRRYGIPVTGLHMHASHVIMSPEAFQRGAAHMFHLAEKFPQVRRLDFGGGYNIAGRHDAPETRLAQLAGILAPLHRDFARRGRELELWFEPGRYLVARAGSLVVKTEIVKTNGRVLVAGTDSGFNHLIRPRLYGAYHEIANLSNPGGRPILTDVYGNLCEQDPFAVDWSIPEIREGDILCIRDAGGYGFAMSSQYNSRYRPAEVLLIGGSAHLIRRRETLEDLIRGQIIIDDLSAVTE